MTTRRTFVKQTCLAGTGLLLGNISRVKNDQLIGLQLFTLRNEIAKERIETTMAKVAGIGFNSVEIFGYDKGRFFGKTPGEFSAILRKNHLKTPSGHYMMLNYLTKDDRDDMKKTIADAAAMGHDYVVIPYLFDSMRTSLDDYKKLATKLNLAAAEAKTAGLKLAYHNHNFEFKDWGEGKTGFEIFQKETDPSLVSFEIDFYWIVRAGLDPVRIIKENPGRIKLWHVKDMAAKQEATFTTEGEQHFTEVGTGIINYSEIFLHRKESGMEYFYVEQDQTRIPVYESITKSLNYMKKLFKG